MCSLYSTASVPDGRESVVWELTAGSAHCWENWGLAFKGSTLSCIGFWQVDGGDTRKAGFSRRVGEVWYV